MEKNEQQMARQHLVAAMLAGQSWQEIARAGAVPLKRAMAYRVVHAVRTSGDAALADGRHGHPSKLRGEARAFLEEQCRQAPSTPSSTLQVKLRERFEPPREYQPDQPRASSSRSEQPSCRPKTGKKTEVEEVSPQAEWQEGAGGLLLLAAAHQTNLLTHLEAALSPSLFAAAPSLRLARLQPATLRRQLLTLLFLEAVGLRRTWDLRGYTGNALALLTNRHLAYGYRHTERFLAELAQLGADEVLTEALASWTASLWKRQPAVEGSPTPVFYIDGHRKAVYTDHLIPRGLVGRLEKILGCRALVVLHDQEGHPLLVTTYRGDQHLTVGLPAIITRYEQAADLRSVERVVVDREGMAAEFLATLASQGRTVVTVLRTDQYADLESFREVGEFAPLRVDRYGKVTREVALARFSIPLPEHPGQELDLRVALIRDLCRHVADDKRPEDEDGPLRWDEKPDGTHEHWLDASWQATPLPAKPTVPKLIPIVTTALEANAMELAQTYTRRWPAQENAIRDWLIPLGIDVNHGYAQTPVVNSEVAKKREALQKRLDNVRRWADAARKRMHNASKLYRKRCQLTKERADALYRVLNTHQMELERQGVDRWQVRQTIKEEKAVADAEIEDYQQRQWKAYHTSNTEFAKCEKYCREQRELLRAIEDLAQQEREMYELDNRKDQMMTACKVALANVGMWVRDHYFPAEYAHASWHRLQIFFQLPGRIFWGTDTVEVELKPFNDRALNRDVMILCTKVAQDQPHLPDGRRLIFRLQGTHILHLDAQEKKWRETLHWYVIFTGEREQEMVSHPAEESAGIDLGLVHFATLSDGSTLENPRHLRQAEHKLKKVQEALSRKKRGSKRRRKAAQRVGKTHRHIRNQRKDFHHKEARKLVTQYQTMVFEKLAPSNMSKRPKPKQDETTGQCLPNGASAKAGLNKSILDAGWGQFQQICESKAACAGSRILFVSPKYTSQRCSGCGAMVQKGLEERWHSCSCGCSLDRDHNAAKNILQLGLQALETESRARTERSGDAPLRSPRL